MREIKFRAWDNVHTKAMEGMVYQDHPNFNGRVSEFWEWVEQHPPMPIMQYTGLKDKNGKDVYEGDIIDECTYIAFCDECKAYQMFFSNFDEKPYCAACNGDFTWVEFQEYPPTIIGNIHENPELLEFKP